MLYFATHVLRTPHVVPRFLTTVMNDPGGKQNELV
jgi:hypothetical protein